MPWYRLKSGTPWFSNEPPYPGAPEVPEPGSEPVDPAPAVPEPTEADAKKGTKKK